MSMACLESRRENFRGWLKNREIRESFSLESFPLYGKCICDRIWENPAYRENAQAAQCALLVSQIKKCQKSCFCHIHVKKPFY